MWLKQNKWKIIIPIVIAAILVIAFFSGRAPSEDDISDTMASAPVSTPVIENYAEASPTPDAVTGATENAGSEEYSEANGMELDEETGKDKYETAPVPEGKPVPVEPEDVEIGDEEYTCTLSISCATILNNKELCDPDKWELVPEDGWILMPVELTFYEGESVFNVLRRSCKQLGIHMEFSNTPVYNSAYIEGIGNLYEFDVGELSGWKYKVNDWFPNYGCSRYQLKDGDVVCWEYTCDLGYDLGSGFTNQADQ